MCKASKDWYPYDREVVQNNSRFLNKGICAPGSIQHLSTLFVNLGCRGLLIARCIFEALPSTIRVLGNMRYPIWKITDLIVFLNKLSLHGQISLHKCWGKVWKMPVDPLQLYYTLFSFLHEQSQKWMPGSWRDKRERQHLICGYRTTLLFENPKNLLHPNQLWEHPHHHYYFPLEWVI